MKCLFLLDPEVHFLNHGSFGACPRPVFDAYQGWQLELERQPVAFLGRHAAEMLSKSRAALAEFVGVAADDVVFFPNPTTAINMVARAMMGRSGLRLKPGDEILTTNHEYGAMERTWRYVCRETGARYVSRTVPLPLSCHADFVEHFWAGVTDRTRIIFISHITSPTALLLPVAEICRRARQAGILSIVDGAHAPGQVPLNLAECDADIYTGACHKWLCAPKGPAFIYAKPEVQPFLEPLVVSWGWEAENPGPSRFIDWHEWQGTRDLAAFLSVPAAIVFSQECSTESAKRRCRDLAARTHRRIVALTGLTAISADLPGSDHGLLQFFAALLPPVNANTLKERLLSEFRVEVPVYSWNGMTLVRPSFQIYNDEADADALVEGLRLLLQR